MNIGEINNFNVKAWHDWAWELVKCDELKEALRICESGPGYYRDNPPEEIKALKQKIMTGLMTSYDYAKNKNDNIVSLDRGTAVRGTLRGMICLLQVQEYNKAGKTPHIIDLGPGEYWLPCGLHIEGCKFTYEGICLQDDATHKALELIGQYFQKGAKDDQPVIFNACEIIEHLWNPYEIKQTFYKFGGRADIVYLSTPRYTFGGGCMDWDDPKNIGLLGHLRTYTPQEFVEEAVKMFPEYQWQVYESEHKMLNEIMMLVGKVK